MIFQYVLGLNSSKVALCEHTESRFSTRKSVLNKGCSMIAKNGLGALGLGAILLSIPACASDRPQTSSRQGENVQQHIAVEANSQPTPADAQASVPNQAVNLSKPVKIVIYSQPQTPSGTIPAPESTGSTALRSVQQPDDAPKGSGQIASLPAPNPASGSIPAPSREKIDKAANEASIQAQINAHDGPVPVIENPTSCGKNAYELDIDVVNADKNKGRIVADLSDRRETFLVGNKTLLRIWQKPVDGKASFCVPLTGPGEYTLALYQDKNENLKLDKNFLGIPKERFGMSTNPHFGLKAPKYDDVKFQVKETRTHLLIKLRKASDIL